MFKRLHLIILITILSITHAASMHARTFVNPVKGQIITDVLKNIGDTIDQVRYSVADIIITPTTLNTPGSYVLGDFIEGSIVINADDVQLDLNNFNVFSSSDTTTLVTVKSNKKNVAIFNGSLRGSGKDTNMASGILVEEGAQSVQVDNVFMTELENGIFLDGTSTGTIKACQVTHCIFDKVVNGVIMNHAIKCTFDHCDAKNCYQNGFVLTNCQFNVFKECNTLEIINDDPDIEISGFSSTEGKGNFFLGCIAQGLSNIVSNTGADANGFLFGDNETGSKIIDCIANQIECSGSGDMHMV